MKSIFIGIFISIASSITFAQEVPQVSQDPKMNLKLNVDQYEFLAATLHTGKVAKDLECRFTTRASKELRKFSDGEKWVEFIDFEFEPDGFYHKNKFNFKIPLNAKFGKSKAFSNLHGPVEVLKIQTGDADDSTIRITHNGRNLITDIEVVSYLRVLPCMRAR